MFEGDGPPPSWDVVLFRSMTDPDFRDALLRDPDGELRKLGLLAPTQTIAVHELVPNQRILILPPAADPRAAIRRSLGNSKRVETGADSRRPYSDEPPSEPLIGPAACGLEPRTYGS